MEKPEDTLETEGIPKNYFCEFSIDLKEDVVYGVEIYRFDRYQIQENIDLSVIVEYDDETSKFDYVSDEVIRKNSVYNKFSSVSKAVLLFRNKDKTRLEFYVLNKKVAEQATFKIVIMEDYDASM
jgi:hypothetical protein